MPKVLLALGLAAMLAMPTSVFAADHQVLMLNKDSEGRPMQFEPAFLKVAPGDTVTFVPQDKGHNSESFAGKIPEGAEAWKGKINEQITVTLTTEGYYVYRCLPHFALGMVGLIQVGESATLDAAALTDKLPGKAKPRMEELIAEAQEQ
jgi:pseudoazurin